MAPQTHRPRRRLAALAALPLLLAGLPLATGAEPDPDDVASPVSAAETAGQAGEIVEVTVADQDAVIGLIEAGADVTEYTRPVDGGLLVHVVATPAEQAVLRDLGYAVGDVVVSAAETAAVVAGRDAAVRRADQTFARLAESLTPLRAEWFESVGGQTYLGVEVKSSLGADSSTVLTVSFGGQSVTMDRFVDAGQYIYHTFFEPVAVDDVPAEVTVTSSGGASITVPVVEWLGDPRPEPGPHYATGFVDHYMDPTELYERIEALAAEFPDLAEIIELPYQTNGYRRKAQAMIGTGASAFYVTSRAWGHEGGNDLRLETVNPGTASSPLGVTVAGATVRVSLGTDAAGAPNSTAAQVVAAVNASPAASALVTASTYRTTGGTGLAVAGGQDLTDGLDAPAEISRDPFTVRAIRIGKVRDGSRTGVFAYSQEHAREWVTPLVALETAERLLRNYANDADTKKLVDDLDIFIIPSVNPDGSHFSFYDRAGQRRNMTNHCGPENSDPERAATSWGVDLNRNFSVGSRFDGYSGASASCTSDTYSGPAELSEPEARNEVWLTQEYPNIEFAMNVHSYGGYFMWPPGAYVSNGRVPLPRPTLGEENYFWAASSHILSAVQDWRGTAVWPGRTGPVSDVLYSAAGNSADEHWYNRGIFGWDFEVGADLWDPVEREWDPQGFQPPFAEGYEQAMEFSNGLIGLLEVARSYGRDNRPPRTTLELTDEGVTFESTEPVTIHYTLDGSRPTYSSPRVESAGLREPAAPIPVGSGSTRVHWFSVDAAGNVENRYDPLRPSSSYRKQTVRVD
ncbi:M14 family zinc carboxypeptidase [Jiangella endophytica]|uniref:M14 family zinc carboxypeptidase n=1 Tax=Jiangella endophytica TaxID=1623398 RepID=UPI000E34FBC1|nr:M14 family zinc carboxypeptidase [Jiangella endophytica]